MFFEVFLALLAIATMPLTLCVLQVLRSVHPNDDKAVYSTTSAKVAVWLPQALFVKWAAAAAAAASAAPAIDLRGVQLTPSQWCMLAVAVCRMPEDAVCHMPEDALTSMHLRGTTLLDGVEEKLEIMRTYPNPSHFYCSCKTGMDVRVGENLPFMAHCGMLVPVSQCPSCLMGPSNGDRLESVLKPPSAPIRNIIAHDHMQMLGTVQAVVSFTTALHTLGLHDLQLFPQSISALEDLFGSLPESLTHLHLSTRNEFGQGTVGVEEKKQFFRAVALVRSLKELHMPQWKAFVGGHAGFCCEPLRSIPWLRMLVPTVQQSPAFPPGLIFQATK